MAMTMHQLYMAPRTEYCDSPMSFATVPDLMPSYEDLSTDPSPSPPEVHLICPQLQSGADLPM